ncbi:hypothetical protein BDZ97DRAFT_662597 [Flammula alnicola]|nr:hypothetical protein BDZ97DRAFT_662597 [Flammula alnicola]
MHKRFHGQRQHIIHSMDALLYQLHTLSFFLSPSIWIYVCRVLSQFQYSKPRELDPTRSLRFFYTIVLLFNLPSLWYHSTRGAVEGRIVILDFIGMSYTPSKTQLCFLDLFIIILQLLLTTIAYETSVYYASDEADPQDMLLPGLPTPFAIPIFQPPIATQQESSFSSTMPPTHPKRGPISTMHEIPLVIDLHLNSIMTHLRHPPPPPRVTNPGPILPVPNTTPWQLPGMRMLMRASRQMRETGGTRAPAMGRVPGGLDTGPGQ